MDKLTEVIAQTLKIAPQDVQDDLAYGSIPGWDSLAHVSLMLQIESDYDVEIDEDTMVELTTVGAIRKYVEGVAA
ncbi:acyl carrier protein [Sphingomonas sp. BN140010]|uniref:Acyl carrier protein n=1 Tax=Sphingomonas arvum TaxID=2992113 RepID=A0ABT3JF10_9SPHN|nr:acyl carrier protein [Sphingomonas sp. BN140010]MCW3797594.1 acyl carrier protein [Sphingomonas sp. BN140010]